jgi:methionine-rich copper-binding protein CopC
MVAGAAVFACAVSGLTPALAHASLTKCSIKNNQVFRIGHSPKSIHATFAEPLDTNRTKTWMAVFEGQADHGLVTEKQRSVVNFKNPKQMTLKLPKLGKEKYYLIWYTHSAVDGHYAAGIVYFSVK